MKTVKYIHAADLHLDASFGGLARDTGGKALIDIAQKSTFDALDRLESLCKREKPDFLVLAGDLWNQEHASIKSHIKLRDACRRLGEAGIKVFMAHGNHDPLSSRFEHIQWPDNVITFGADKPESHKIYKDGEPLALIHGVSHATAKESRNLAQLFNRDESYNGFQLGVLHCALDNCALADRYAPCSLKDLQDSGLDAWALGHAHDWKILCQQPFIAYSGNTQGLHILENGARGCLIVTASDQAGQWRCDAQFQPLGPVRWETVGLDAGNLEKTENLEINLNYALTRLMDNMPSDVRGVIARVRLDGRTILDKWLRGSEAAQIMAETAAPYENSLPPLWLKDCKINTQNYTKPEDYLSRADLLGETARVWRELSSHADKLYEMKNDALAPLLEKPRLRKYFDELSEEQLKELLRQAESICQDILEEE